MARPLRIQFPGAYLHIISRGNAKHDIFLDDADRRCWLRTLDDVMIQFEWLCFAYVLMDNHYHLFVQIPGENLSEGMRQLNGLYTQRFNKRHRRVEHVFQGRYISQVIESDTYFLELVRYIILNPVRAKMATRIAEWPWTSYQKTVGKDSIPPSIASDRVLGLFGNDRGNAIEEFERFLQEGADGKIRLPSAPGGIIGTEEFIESITNGEVLTNDQEFSINERLISRPTLEELFSTDATDLNARNEAILFARKECKYRVREIAEFLDLHPSSISRLIKEC